VRGPLDAQLRAATAAVVDHLGTELVVLGVRRYPGRNSTRTAVPVIS
jgi:hypothetical protein